MPHREGALCDGSSLDVACTSQAGQNTGHAWVRAQGTLVNETKCLECGTVTAREEAFYDLSLDIEQNCSLTACLRNFRCGARAAGSVRSA